MSDASPQINVAILAVPEVTASATYAMYDLFLGAGRDWAFITTGVAGAVAHAAIYCRGSDRTRVCSANGIGIKPDYALDDCPEPALVCIPDFSLLPGASCTGVFDVEVAWLRRCHAAGATLASVCTSTSLLAATGLLDGLDATIHWAYATTLSAALSYSARSSEPRPGRSLAIGQRIVMAGGGTSHLDLALYLIGRFVGLREALDISKAYLINWHDAGQQPFASFHVSQQANDGLIARCQAWIAEHLRGSVAGRQRWRKLSSLPERTFVRRFIKATGLSPLDMCIRFGWRRPSRFWRRRIFRSRRSQPRLATRMQASSAACSGARLDLPLPSTVGASRFSDALCAVRPKLRHTKFSGGRTLV